MAHEAGRGLVLTISLRKADGSRVTQFGKAEAHLIIPGNPARDPVLHYHPSALQAFAFDMVDSDSSSFAIRLVGASLDACDPGSYIAMGDGDGATGWCATKEKAKAACWQLINPAA